MYNLVQLLVDLDCEVVVKRNDKIELNEVNDFQKVLLSPGPGLPSEANLLISIIKEFYKTKSILGVCLGHQAIVEVFGGKIKNLEKVYHGVSEMVFIKDINDSLFTHLPNQFMVGRYHSWCADSNCLPNDLKITAQDKNGIVMGVKHTLYDVHGLQFHPESVLTEYGKEIISNWINS